MKYTIKQIKASLPQNKASKEPIWAKIFIRRISYYITYLFINTNWTADGVSLLSILFAVGGSIVMCVNSKVCIYIGVLLLNCWCILDCVDGNIARCLKKSSYVGEFMDALSGYITSGLCMLGFGMAAYNTSLLIPDKYRIYLLLLSAAGGICDILSRLIYQKYSNCMMKMEYERIGGEGIKTENDGFYDNGKNTFLKRLALRVDYELGIGGDEFLILIFMSIFNLMDVFVIGYSLYHIASVLLIGYMYVKKITVYKKTYLCDK